MDTTITYHVAPGIELTVEERDGLVVVGPATSFAARAFVAVARSRLADAHVLHVVVASAPLFAFVFGSEAACNDAYTRLEAALAHSQQRRRPVATRKAPASSAVSAPLSKSATALTSVAASLSALADRHGSRYSGSGDVSSC